jgi:hypothetical protein
MEMMRSLVLGGERVASYSKKFCFNRKNFTERGKDSCQLRPSVEIQKLGVPLSGALRRNSCLKKPSIEAATQTSEGAADLCVAELVDEEARVAAAIDDGAAAMVGAFAGVLDARTVAELLVGAVELTKARTGMRKDLKLVPAALTVR